MVEPGGMQQRQAGDYTPPILTEPQGGPIPDGPPADINGDEPAKDQQSPE